MISINWALHYLHDKSSSTIKSSFFLCILYVQTGLVQINANQQVSLAIKNATARDRQWESCDCKAQMP